MNRRDRIYNVMCKWIKPYIDKCNAADRPWHEFTNKHKNMFGWMVVASEIPYITRSIEAVYDEAFKKWYIYNSGDRNGGLLITINSEDTVKLTDFDSAYKDFTKERISSLYEMLVEEFSEADATDADLVLHTEDSTEDRVATIDTILDIVTNWLNSIDKRLIEKYTPLESINGTHIVLHKLKFTDAGYIDVYESALTGGISISIGGVTGFGFKIVIKPDKTVIDFDTTKLFQFTRFQLIQLTCDIRTTLKHYSKVDVKVLQSAVNNHRITISSVKKTIQDWLSHMPDLVTTDIANIISIYTLCSGTPGCQFRFDSTPTGIDIMICGPNVAWSRLISINPFGSQIITGAYKAFFSFAEIQTLAYKINHEVLNVPVPASNSYRIDYNHIMTAASNIKIEAVHLRDADTIARVKRSHDNLNEVLDKFDKAISDVFDDKSNDGGKDKMTISNVKQVMFNKKKGVTTVIFVDGVVVTSKTLEGDTFSPEIGYAMCIMKRIFGNRSKFKKMIKHYERISDKRDERKEKIESKKNTTKTTKNTTKVTKTTKNTTTKKTTPKKRTKKVD